MKQYKKLTVKMLDETLKKVEIPNQPFLNDALNKAAEQEMIKLLNEELSVMTEPIAKEMANKILEITNKNA